MKKNNQEIYDPTPTLDYDAIKRLQRLERREIFLMDEIDCASVGDAIEDILFLEAKDKEKPITLYLSSPGGSVGDGFALIDVMLTCKCSIKVIAIGEIASMASAIYIVGTKGLRLIGKNAWIMFHPISQDMREDYVKFQKSRVLQAEDLQKQYEEIVFKHTEIPKDIYNKSRDAELWLPAAEAIKYKIADDYYKGRQ
jgi:ATP-dependent Clp protease protease subunit